LRYSLDEKMLAKWLFTNRDSDYVGLIGILAAVAIEQYAYYAAKSQLAAAIA
jgi:hypothetical protein